MDLEQVVATIERLLAESDERAEELVRTLMQLYGEGLARIVEIVRDTGYAERLANDKLIGSLLLLHDLHPVDAESRLKNMLARLEQSFGSHFQLESIEDGVARIRVEPNGTPLPPGIGEVIERAALDSAPELARVEVAGLPPGPLVQIELARSG